MEVNTEKIKAMSMQETFDYIVEHMAKQKRRSSNGESCLYRGVDDSACAVGCLLPDDVAAMMDNLSSMEWNTGMMNDRVRDIAKPFLPPHQIDFFVEMQRAHDGDDDDAAGDHSPQAVRERLRTVANDFSLNADKVALITEWA